MKCMDERLNILHNQLIYANEKLSEAVNINDIKYDDGLDMLKSALVLIKRIVGEE